MFSVGKFTLNYSKSDYFTDNNFDNYLITICERLHNSVVTNDFANYFDRSWVPCKETWDYYYREGLGINTNMF